MDLASLRAEIKAWERDFRSKHARDPTIQDIKNQPATAAKYKLYKSLSRAASSHTSTIASSASRSATPPRSQSRQDAYPSTSTLLTKSRAVRVDPPNQTSNPFSPVKRKMRDSAHNSNQPLDLTHSASRLNPFTTPTKPRTNVQPKLKPSAPPRSPSPDPFPLIHPSQPVDQTTSVLQTPPVHSAVSRARKRLRGEPVSPSPVKEKRARVGSPRTVALPTTLLYSDEDGSPLTGRVNREGDETFIEATPMKPPPGGKSFRLLFEEVLPDAKDASRQPHSRTLSRTTSTINKMSTKSTNVVQSRAISPSSSEDEKDNWQVGAKLQGLLTSTSGVAVTKRPGTQQKHMNNGIAKRGPPRAIIPGKDDLWSDVVPVKGPSLKPPARGVPGGSKNGDAAPRSATKRRLPDEQSGQALDETDGSAHNGNSFLRLPLLPPSPPQADPSAKSYNGGSKDRGKGKGAAAFSRKKARLLEQLGEAGHDDSSLDDTDEEEGVKIRDLTRQGRLVHAELRDELYDSEFSWHPRPLHALESPPLVETAVESGTMEIHLPDSLKRILALSPKRDVTREEEKLVKGLLYGRRENHYDAKSGEIWGVGEINEAEEEVAGDTEEDWEGEPIPWEVGEL